MNNKKKLNHFSRIGLLFVCLAIALPMLFELIIPGAFNGTVSAAGFSITYNYNGGRFVGDVTQFYTYNSGSVKKLPSEDDIENRDMRSAAGMKTADFQACRW